MRWDVEFTDEFQEWYLTLTQVDQDRVGDAVSMLGEYGPGLGRPWVDAINGSEHGHMKELRTRGAAIRILFVFDPRRTAILLLGGTKRGRWKLWYAENIPRADKLYDTYLNELREEGLMP